MKNTYILLGIVFAFVFGGLIGYVIHPSQSIVAGSPTGATFNTAKFAGVVVNLANTGANGTSTTLVNTDSSNRYIVSTTAACSGVGTSYVANTGAGLASITLKVATTTTTSPASIGTNYAANLTIATSSIVTFNSTSTEGVIAGTSRVWPAGTDLTFFANATNTAVCTVGVNYIGS